MACAFWVQEKQCSPRHVKLEGILPRPIYSRFFAGRQSRYMLIIIISTLLAFQSRVEIIRQANADIKQQQHTRRHCPTVCNPSSLDFETIACRHKCAPPTTVAFFYSNYSFSNASQSWWGDMWLPDTGALPNAHQ